MSRNANKRQVIYYILLISRKNKLSSERQARDVKCSSWGTAWFPLKLQETLPPTQEKHKFISNKEEEKKEKKYVNLKAVIFLSWLSFQKLIFLNLNKFCWQKSQHLLALAFSHTHREEMGCVWVCAHLSKSCEEEEKYAWDTCVGAWLFIQSWPRIAGELPVIWKV